MSSRIPSKSGAKIGEGGAAGASPHNAADETVASIDRDRLRELDVLVPNVYKELRELAQLLFCRERPDHTLQPTAVVHETYLRLARQRRLTWDDRIHFVALAARVMRHVLVDHARRRGAQKRGGDLAPNVLTSQDTVGKHENEIDLVALNELLKILADVDPRQANIVELRFFGGLTIPETAEVLGLSHATVEREWAMARAWLFSKLA